MSDTAHAHLPILADEPSSGFVVPAIVADTHRDAPERFIEYFAATIRNTNTRAAYMNAVADFLRFEPVADLGSLAEVRSIHVSLYMESVGDRFAPQTVKLRLAAIRGLFDWLARHGVLEINPATPVRGPSYSCSHIGIGDTVALGGTCHARLRLEGVIRAPEITVDGQLLTKGGDILLDDGAVGDMRKR